jgi:serine/threonine protein kinase
MDLRVGKHYQLIKKIGSGAFGEIYEGKSEF